MIETILTAIAPVMLTALIGFFWTRSGRSIEAQGLTQIVTEIGTPCLVFSTFAKMSVPAGAFAVTAAASLTILIGFLIIATLVLKLCGLSLRTYRRKIQRTTERATERGRSRSMTWPPALRSAIHSPATAAR